MLLMSAVVSGHGGPASLSVVSRQASLFGISRGGGLFGGKDNQKDAAESTPAEDDGEKKMYPAMSQEEIEEWLGHIPVFAVTDKQGQGVVLRPDNETSVFYFFMNPIMANATLQQLTSANSDLELQVSAFSLGKIWFQILKASPDTPVKIKSPNAEESDETAELTQGVQYRLIPDTRDLMGARMLLTMDPKDGEALKQGGTLTPEVAQAAVRKAMTESPKFNSTYNEIPIFMIQQMRMVKQPKDGSTPTPETIAEAQTMLPMYFNLATMVSTWQQFTAGSEEAKNVEPAINLMDLFEIVDKMQEESEIDWRNVLLIPPSNMSGERAVEDPVASMQAAGAPQTLGDI